MALGISRILRLSAFVLAGVCLAAGQSKRPEDLATGKILVTSRDSIDPRLAESVILIVRFNENGAVGLMMNRRTTVPISKALQELKGSAAHTEPVFVGGPAGLNTVLTLTRASDKPVGSAAVFGNVAMISAKGTLEQALGAAVDPKDLRIYLGYCGWGRHQLEREVGVGAWYIFDRNEDLTFDAEPETLWTRMIAHTEAQIVRLGFPLRH